MDHVWYEVDLLHADEHERFLQLVLLFLIGLVRYNQIANQNAEFLKRQYFKKDLMEYLEFLLMQRPLPHLLEVLLL